MLKLRSIHLEQILLIAAVVIAGEETLLLFHVALCGREAFQVFGRCDEDWHVLLLLN